jgi:hypothetical protein
MAGWFFVEATGFFWKADLPILCHSLVQLLVMRLARGVTGRQWQGDPGKTHPDLTRWHFTVLEGTLHTRNTAFWRASCVTEGK